MESGQCRTEKQTIPEGESLSGAREAARTPPPIPAYL